jgi:hypothetical protein
VTVDDVRNVLGVPADPVRDEQIGWAVDAACSLWAYLTGRVDPDNPESVAQVTDQGRQFVTLAAVRYFDRFQAPFGIAGGFETGAVYVMRSDPDLVSLLTGERLSFGVA